MKSILSLLAVCFLAFTIVSCNKDGAISKEFEVPAQEYTFPAVPAAGSISYEKSDINFKVKEKLAQFDVKESQIKSLALTEVKAIIDESSDVDFEIFESGTLKFTTNKDSEVITVATLKPTKGKVAEFETNDVELKEVLLMDSFNAILEGTTKEGYKEALKVTIKSKVKLKASLL